MIVCISGPSSTGKSTLLSELQVYFTELYDLIKSRFNLELEFIPELIRDLVPDNSLDEIFSNDEDSVKFQIEVIHKSYNRFKDMFSDVNKLYIVDRSPLDALVYLILNYSCSSTQVLQKFAKDFEECSILSRLAYNLYISRVYLTSTDHYNYTSVQVDGFRPTKYLPRRVLEVELFNYIFNHQEVQKLPANTPDRVLFISNDLISLIKSRKN